MQMPLRGLEMPAADLTRDLWGLPGVGEGIQKMLKNQRQQCLRRKYSAGHLDVVLGVFIARWLGSWV